MAICQAYSDRCDSDSGSDARNSDDFNLKYDNAHPDFIHLNTYMSILTSHLSLVPDFDMFATSPDHWPVYHAFLRALSPGPTLVSDTPDVTTDMSILNKLTAKTAKSVVGSDRLGGEDSLPKVVKTDRPAVALPGRWFWDNLQGDGDGPAIIASVNIPKSGGAIIGAWNCRNASTQCWAKDRISLQDLEEALEVDQLEHDYVLYSMRLSDRGREKYRIVKPGDKVHFEVNLARAECEGYVVARIWELAGGRKIAILGLLDKFAPLVGIEVSVNEQGELLLSDSNTLSGGFDMSVFKR
jgi:hypothetical protein